MLVTNAISFIRRDAATNRLEIYTDVNSATVDTQITAVSNNGTFTAGTFNGIICRYARKHIGCTVSNTKNDATTKLIYGGQAADIYGSATTRRAPGVSEVPTGATNGVNRDFRINAPIPKGSEHVYINGVHQNPINDYVMDAAGTLITFAVAPLAADEILVDHGGTI